jgi:hypothetical protein
MSSESKNLKAISDAIKQHNSTCEFPATAILMNPFEVDRLDWPDIMGVPIEADSSISTGRFRIVCDKDFQESEAEEVEAISRDTIYAT